MPKYEVTIKQTEIYVFEEIEADSEQDAEAKAWERFTDDENAKQKYHHDSDGDTEVFEI